VGDIHVILRCSTERIRRLYDEVQKDFPQIVLQDQHSVEEFKPMLQRSLAQLPHEYIIFAVDDIIVTDYTDIDYCIRMMQTCNAYGFYLRLGKNCTRNHDPGEYAIALPPFLYDQESLCVWRFSDGEFDWGYPHTVDMTIYKKSEIMDYVTYMDYRNPNTFEGSWDVQSWRIKHRLGICFEHSHMVNVPMNNVQEVAPNHNMGISLEMLLDTFASGKKIDIDQFYTINNTSSHMDIWPKFKQR
jgi:hypothetical protein